MTTIDRPLAGKNVIVTGASRGLGACIARAMWHAGAHLLLVARTESALLQLKGKLEAEAGSEQRVEVLTADLASRDAVPAIVARARGLWDRLDALVNNAAVPGPIGKVWENDWEEWQATLRVNLLAPVELCRACLPWMIAERRGKIVNISGGGAAGPRPHFSAYAVAKTGLVRFSEILAEEARDANVQVNCVAPGAMNTEMTRAVLRAGLERAGAAEYRRAAEQVGGSGTKPERAAELCVFLASSASDGITGKLISAVWDPWERLSEHRRDLASDVYTLRRILPGDRGMDWA